MANRTSINNSELFKLAWKLYRTPSYKGAKIPTKLNRLRFANCLKMAWSNARYEALPVSAKIELVQDKINQLKYAPWGISTTDKSRALQSQISQLQSQAA